MINAIKKIKQDNEMGSKSGSEAILVSVAVEDISRELLFEL